MRRGTWASAFKRRPSRAVSLSPAGTTDSPSALEILAANERNLLHDGGVNFGFGSQEGHDEVFIGPFKILTIYADAPAKYREALRRLDFEEHETLKTLWDCLSRDNPGRRSILNDAGPTRREMLETLKPQGLYFSEHRED